MNDKKKQKPIYIIEHLEPKLFEWCLIEYENISRIVGKKKLWFTNISKKDSSKLKKFGKVYNKRLSELKLIPEKICLLDPEAKEVLSSKEMDKFDFLVFGGILGDYPPKKRTKKELTKFFPNSFSRNIGKKQMSTDNAVYTVKQIEKGKKLSQLKFVDGVSIKLGKFESVELPYYYNLAGSKPFYSKKIVSYLKNKKGF